MMHLQPVVHVPELEEINLRLSLLEERLLSIELILSDLRGLATLTVQGTARILDMEGAQMADLTALTQEVSENGDVIDGAVTLLGSLSQQIRDLATDPAALQALADDLDAQTNALASAVAENTPAAPEDPRTDDTTNPDDGVTNG